MFRIDGYDRAVESGFYEISRYDRTHRGRSIACTDERDRFRLKEKLKVVDSHYLYSFTPILATGGGENSAFFVYQRCDSLDDKPYQRCCLKPVRLSVSTKLSAP